MNTNIISQTVTGALGWVDITVVFLSVLLLFVISYLFGREEKDTKDFFLGSRRVPWIVACLSFVATEVSALTIVGVPATAFSENWEYLQFFIGSAAARIVVAFLFIPIFYKHD
jgi:Na+/proline symporter